MRPATASGRRDLHHHARVALHEAVRESLGLLEYLDAVEALHDLFPQDAKLQIGEAVAHAAMDPEPERHVLAGVLALDVEGVRILEDAVVAVARHVPHDDA